MPAFNLKEKKQILEDYRAKLRAPTCEEYATAGFCALAPNCPKAHLCSNGFDLAIGNDGLQDAGRLITSPKHTMDTSVTVIDLNDSVHEEPAESTGATTEAVAVPAIPSENVSSATLTPTNIEFLSEIGTSTETEEEHTPEIEALEMTVTEIATASEPETATTHTMTHPVALEETIFTHVEVISDPVLNAAASWDDPVEINYAHLQRHPEDLKLFLYKVHAASSMFSIPIPMPPYDE